MLPGQHGPLRPLALTCCTTTAFEPPPAIQAEPSGSTPIPLMNVSDGSPEVDDRFSSGERGVPSGAKKRTTADSGTVAGGGSRAVPASPPPPARTTPKL